MSSPTSSSITQQQFKQAETEIAVLQVQYNNLSDKVDEVKEDLKEVRDSIGESASKTHKMLKEFQEENTRSHKEMAAKIASLEKWRWMMMGAGIVVGALGSPVIASILNVG